MATIRTRFGNVNFVDGSTVGAKVNTKVETTLPTSFNFVSTVSNPDGDTQRIQAISYSSTSIKEGLSQYFLTSYNPEGQYKLDFNYNTGYLGLKRVTDIADATNAGKIALEPEIQDWVRRGVHEMIMRTNTDMQVGSSYLPLILYSSDIPHYYHKKILEDNTTEIIDKPIALAEDVSTLKDQVLALSGGTMTGNINYQFGNESATTGIYWNMPRDAAAIYTEGVPDDSTNLILKVSDNDNDNIRMIYYNYQDHLNHDILVANGQGISIYNRLTLNDNGRVNADGNALTGYKYDKLINQSNTTGLNFFTFKPGTLLVSRGTGSYDKFPTIDSGNPKIRLSVGDEQDVALVHNSGDDHYQRKGAGIQVIGEKPAQEIGFEAPKLYEGAEPVATQSGMKSSGSSKYAYYIYDSNVPTDPISIRYHGPGAGIDYVTGFAGYHQTEEGTNNSIVPVQKSDIINWIKTTRSTLTISQGALKTAYNGNEDKSISIGNPSAINNVTYTKNPNTEATSAGENVTLIDNGRISGGKAQKIYPKTKAELVKNGLIVIEGDTQSELSHDDIDLLIEAGNNGLPTAIFCTFDTRIFFVSGMDSSFPDIYAYDCYNNELYMDISDGSIGYTDEKLHSSAADIIMNADVTLNLLPSASSLATNSAGKIIACTMISHYLSINQLIELIKNNGSYINFSGLININYQYNNGDYIGASTASCQCLYQLFTNKGVFKGIRVMYPNTSNQWQVVGPYDSVLVTVGEPAFSGNHIKGPS